MLRSNFQLYLCDIITRHCSLELAEQTTINLIILLHLLEIRSVEFLSD